MIQYQEALKIFFNSGIAGNEQSFEAGWDARVLALDGVLESLQLLLKDVDALTKLITGSPPETTIKGEIESQALWVGNHPFVLNGLRKYMAYCPCGGIILADTEEWKTPLCDECYTAMGEPETDPAKGTA